MTSSSSQVTLCMNGCGFYGSNIYENLCSSCFRQKYPEKLRQIQEIQQQKKRKRVTEVTSLPQIEEEPVEEKELPKPKKIRCSYDTCNRKLPCAAQYSCKCGNMYCKYHRFITDHDCLFDYQQEHARKLEKDNPTIKSDKVDMI